MAFGKHVGSKIDRYGSTLDARRDAMKSASRIAGKSMSTKAEKGVAGSALSQAPKSKGGTKK